MTAIMHVIIIIALITTGPVFGGSPEVDARIAYCDHVFAEIDELQDAKWVNLDDEAMAAKVRQFRRIVARISLPENMQQLDQWLARNNDLSFSELLDAFDQVGGNRLSEHLHAVKQRLEEKSDLSWEDEFVDDLNPYLFHPKLARLTSEDLNDLDELLGEWASIANPTSWNPKEAQASPRSAIIDIVETYSEFLIGRDDFLPSKLSNVQGIADMVALRAIKSIPSGIKTLVTMVTTEDFYVPSDLTGSGVELNRRHIASLRLLYLAEMRFPNSIDVAALKWIGSNLTHNDRRPFGVRYASAMVLAAAASSDGMGRVIALIQPLEDPALKQARLDEIRNQPPKLGVLKSILEEVIAIYQEEGNSDKEYAKIVNRLYGVKFTRQPNAPPVQGVGSLATQIFMRGIEYLEFWSGIQDIQRPGQRE